MSIDKEKKSNRLLASRRYTHDTFTDAQESFTNVLDLQASEVYTQAHKIPSTGLPFSGSSHQGQIYTDGEDNILKYYYRHKLTKSNLNNEVWFFLNPTGSASGIGAQLIDSNQQTSFISPKYSDSSLANATAEDDTPGYLAKVFISTAATSASVSDSDVISVNDYTFDYKTGVLQFTDGTVDPSNSQYVYMSINQYVGKTLADGVEVTGDISGSASSTGSFGHLVVAGNITASGVVRADAFESITGGDTIDFGDSVNVSGNVTATNLVADSGSVSDRLTTITQSISTLKVDSGSFSVRLSDVEAGSTSKTLVSSSAQIADEISGSFTQDSASFSTRITNLKIDSGSISVRLSDVEAGSTSKTLVSSSAQIADEISGSFTADSSSFSTRVTNLVSDSASFSTRITIAEGELENTIISASEQLQEQISGSFTAPSSSFSNRITNLVADSSSFSTRITVAEGELENTLISASKQLEDQISGSFVAPSSSFSSRITTLEGSGEIQSLGTTDNVLFNSITSSNDVKFERNLVVAGKITAQEIHTEIESASIIFTSGSTRFGNTADDIHRFTGSIFVNGNLTAVNLVADSGSVSNRLTEITASINNLKSDSGSFSNRITTVTASIDALKSDSGSFSNRITAATASINALKSDSGSFSTRITVDSSSFSTRVTNLVSDSASFSSRITTAEIELENTIISASEQISDRISGSFVAPSASFSTRITTEESNVDALQVDSASFSTRITNFSTGNIELVSGSVSSTGSFGRVVTTDLLASGESTLKNKLILKSDSSNAILELRSTGGSRINEFQNFNATQIYNSLFLNANEGIVAQDGTYSGGNTRAAIFSIGHIDGTLYHQFGNTNLVAKQTGMGIIDYDTISGSAVSTGSFGNLRVVGMSVPDVTVFSSSLSTRITDDSASISTRLTTEEANVDALQVDSGSFSSRLTNPSVMTLTASKDVHFKQDLKVDGTVTAQEFHTEVVSSSIVFTSGSTRFGNTSDDAHEITGSLSVRGSEIFFGTSSSDRTNLTLKGNNARIQYRHHTNNELYTYLNLGSAGSTFNTNFASDANELLVIKSGETKRWKFNNIMLSGSFNTTASFHHIHGASKLGVGTISPVSTVHISASDGIIIPVGTDAQRNQNPVAGEIRFNTEQSSYEGYDGNNWGTLGGMTDVDKDTKITSEDSAGADNDELKFFTAGSERLRIFADGHISASGNITASGNIIGTNLVADSSSFSARVTAITSSISALKTDSGSFSLRETNLETTSSALINNFDQVQSLGKTDSVVFSNITASNNTQLAGNVLMQSELNILGNITASGNISASGNLFISGDVDINGHSNFNNHVTMSGDLMVNSFNNLKVSSGRTLSHQLSMDVSDAWELDDDGNYMPATEEAFVIDPRFKLDKNGNIHLRKEGNELWTDDVHTYFE